MKQLNQQATKIFCHILEKLNGQPYLKLKSDGFMPLVIELLEENIQTDGDPSKTVSIAHYYEQNGDLMSDPEMVFIVMDKRAHKMDFANLFVYPQCYRQDSLGIYEESIQIINNEIASVKKIWQQGHCHFAAQWLRNISQQGFLK